MLIIALFTSLCLAMPVAAAAFYVGNFTALTVLCVYVTIVSLGLFVLALRGTHEAEAELDEA
ncbi:hypothetical protein [Palleronia sp.]|uniref:hypothetical protein n=1 Tax=Palleronia sp. TaxID=1940284 RepID=UPI0035C82961